MTRLKSIPPLHSDYADDDDDIIKFEGLKVVDGASIYGGSGDDTLDFLNTGAGSEVVAKGNAGDDDIKAQRFRKQFMKAKNDTITVPRCSSCSQSRSYYGDKDDVITMNGNDEASLVSGGEGDDQITMDTVAIAADKKGHTIDGGVEQTYPVTSVALGAAIKKFKTTQQS